MFQAKFDLSDAFSLQLGDFGERFSPSNPAQASHFERWQHLHMQFALRYVITYRITWVMELWVKQPERRCHGVHALEALFGYLMLKILPKIFFGLSTSFFIGRD
ncbi:hypothetical protein [Ensifer aridi]|uniref:hypothetical protein n=1 Tax=Ensifer aridi TaxID=1708715 RepID=UPI001FCDB77F|nr:hypothetical protein [Ensifer aridi]